MFAEETLHGSLFSLVVVRVVLAIVDIVQTTSLTILTPSIEEGTHQRDYLGCVSVYRGNIPDDRLPKQTIHPHWE
jgi:hypothetical protein